MLLIPNVTGCASKAQLLEALKRLRDDPNNKAAQAYADMLLTLETLREEDGTPCEAQGCEQRGTRVYR